MKEYPKPEPLRKLLETDFDAIARQKYEQICQSLPEEEYTGNHPSDFETLSHAEQNALRYWIRHAICYSRAVNTSRDSYGLKHDFEAEGFYITNGQFKGAMLLEGFVPKNIHMLNWNFSVKPMVRRTWALSEKYGGKQYSLGVFDKEYAKLLLLADERDRRDR